MAMLLSEKLATIKKFIPSKKHINRFVKISFWFTLGAMLGFFFFISFLYIFYRKTHDNHVYSGVMVNGIDFGEKTQTEVRDYFANKNTLIDKTTFVLSSPNGISTISARQVHFGYDENLLAHQAYSIGRSGNIISDMSLLVQAYTDGIQLSAAYHYSDEKINKLLEPIKKQNEVEPVNGLFNFENGKVVAFRQSVEGKTVDTEKLKRILIDKLKAVVLADSPQKYLITVPIISKNPEVSSENSNKLGIKEMIGQGTSLFQHSIENRAYNIGLAASKVHGVLIKPGETFSMVQTIGDISVDTGYKQAYVIESGKTVLGDGGGVCQVSTTLFRAALNAGLPIVERNPHAYRVGYYEQDSEPGIDAAIYSPTVDMKFKNDTGHYILVQTVANMTEQRLTFYLYGSKDNRQVVINKPVILSQSPAPPPLYKDDPELPKGVVKQVDFSADGANVYFTRTVTKNGKSYLSDKFVSNYRPWQAIFLKGTKE